MLDNLLYHATLTREISTTEQQLGPKEELHVVHGPIVDRRPRTLPLLLATFSDSQRDISHRIRWSIHPKTFPASDVAGLLEGVLQASST
jgi:hypothetical protein